MPDDYRNRIKNALKGTMRLRTLLKELPESTQRKIDSMIANKKKNGLAGISWKGGDGMLYCKVEDFVVWIEGGMKHAA